MGVITITDEYTSPISPSRLFKAVVLDVHNLIPKLIPQTVKSIDILEGDGGAGSIKQINFAQGSQLSFAKNRVDVLDEKNLVYSYTLIESDALITDKIEYISYEVKFEGTEDGGSKNKMTSTYCAKEGVVLTEEDIKSGKEKALAIYKVVEAYLVQNPDAYA